MQKHQLTRMSRSTPDQVRKVPHLTPSGWGVSGTGHGGDENLPPAPRLGGVFGVHPFAGMKAPPSALLRGAFMMP